MKVIHIYQKERANYDIEIVLNPFAIAMPFYFRKWYGACEIRIFCLSIEIDWIPLPF